MSIGSEPHIHPSEFEEHMAFRNYMRDLILGANDGLVSVFALVVGVAAGGFLPEEVLLTGIAGMVAGAISMSIGEYISTKSQEEVYDAERELEKKHIEDNFEHEVGELREFYTDKGFEGELLETIVQKIASDPEVLLKEMMMAEFGVLEE
ncbi:MAG: VIT1/CCC1 transporter family protein, partial [Candidatus Kariarchaeaceae archaeon]